MEQKLLWVEEINKKKGFFKGQGKDIFPLVMNQY